MTMIRWSDDEHNNKVFTVQMMWMNITQNMKYNSGRLMMMSIMMTAMMTTYTMTNIIEIILTVYQ